MNTPKKHKVLWISPSLQVKGGISTVLKGYCDTQITFNYNIYHVASHVDGCFPKKLYRACVGILRVAWILISKKIGIAHIHAGDTVSFKRKYIFIRAIRTLSPSTKIIYHHHGAAFMEQFEILSAPWKRRVRYAFNSADRVICLSDSWKQNILSIAPEAIVTVVANAVPIPSTPANYAATNQLSLLFLGLVGERKGIFDLIPVIARLKQAGLPVHLNVGGNGDLDRLKKIVAAHEVNDEVTIYGWITGKVKEGLLRRANILVLPSYAEGMPMTLLEAMAIGLPVISTNVGGIPELVHNEKSGLLIQPGDQDALYEQISKLWATPEEQERLGTAARTYVTQTHDLLGIAMTIDSLYRELLNSKK